MARINFSNVMCEVFDKYPNQAFTVPVMVQMLDDRYAVVPKHPIESVSTRLEELTRRGIVTRRKDGNGVYAYRKIVERGLNVG